MHADDDDIEGYISSSSSRYFNSADKGKKDEMESRLKKPIVKDVHALKLSVLKNQVADSKDEDAKRSAKKETKRTFGTKSRDQEAKDMQLDADVKPNPDMMVRQGDIAQTIKEDQEDTGEIQSEPG